MNYFKNCTTTDEAKKTYWKLALKLHPDQGGDTASFQELNNQFEAFRPGKEKFEGEEANWQDLSPVYTNIINELLKLDGITIEIVGSYIWVGGNTYPHKKAIKGIDCGEEMKALWARKKKMWYFKPANYKPRYRKEYDMESIREIYGSQKVGGRKQIAS